MNDINKHEIVGTVASEAHFTEGNVPRLVFNVKTVIKWKDREGNDKETTKTHNVVCWRDLAVENKERIKSGVRVSLVGAVVTNVREKDGEKIYSTETRADQLSVVMD